MSAESHTISQEDTSGLDLDPFKKARDCFMEKLHDDEKATFVHVTSSEQLLADLTNLQHSKDSSPWIKIISAVNACSERLQPYFDIVTIVCQSSAWAAVGWCALRLALKVFRTCTIAKRQLLLTCDS